MSAFSTRTNKKNLLFLFLMISVTFSACSPGIETGDVPPDGADIAAGETVLSDQPPANVNVKFHPDVLYVGDQVSIEVVAPQSSETSTVAVTVQETGGSQTREAEFTVYNFDGRLSAVLSWFWDTTGLEPGDYTVIFSVEPSNLAWSQQVTLLPQEARPAEENDAGWEIAENSCCTVYYIAGTRAERDIEELLFTLDQQVIDIRQRLEMGLGAPMEIALVPRMVGQGGAAFDILLLSYADRPYFAYDIASIFHHELVHKFNRDLPGFGGAGLSNLFFEGFAVYLTGGHYKSESLMARAAALLPPEDGCLPLDYTTPGDTEVCGLNMYVDINSLGNPTAWFAAQHEVAYLEAGALIEYMVDTWGWDVFWDFYQDISTTSELDTALQGQLGISMTKLAADFRIALQGETITAQNANDVKLLVEYSNMARRYQELLDPTAYTFSLWAPDPGQMYELGIVADYMPRPLHEENIPVEEALVAAYESYLQGDFATAHQKLEDINTILNSSQP